MTSESPPAGQSGLVTILFTDLVGSTDLAVRLGDAAADDVRRAHFASLRDAVEATGGTEVKTIGDALMVAYGGAADAIAGAAAMQRAVARQNARSVEARLEMRVGISAGDATFEGGDWFGTPVIEASRLCAAAAGGQILASDLVRALAGSRSAVTLVPHGELDLKGLPEPLATCEAVWDTGEETESAAGALPLPPVIDALPAFPFAGRSSQLDQLISTWKETVDGHRRTVFVSGEPGIGKTRLVTEVVRRAHAQGAIVLWGRCDEELGVPYGPWAEALRHLVAVADPVALRRQLGALGGELARIVPDLPSRVPGIPPPLSTEVEAERHRLFEATSDLLAALSAERPVVVVLDDVHWADKATLLLLRHVLRAPPMAVFVLATYRDTDLDRSHPLAGVLADLRREANVERLDLHGLDEGEVEAFLGAAAGHDLDEAALDLARALHAETEGNPFFVGEVLRHFAESGALVQRDGRWTSDLSLEDVGLPEGIREVVGRRLSRLSEAANEALAVAAVIGLQFDLPIIEMVGGRRGDELFDALDEAERAALVREVPGAPGRYQFAHALVRSSLYEELTTNRRVRLHWKLGEALEARHAGEHLDAIAYHFAEGALAGDPVRAVAASQRAGDRAMAELAFESGVAHYERGLSILDLVDRPDPLVRYELQLALAHALRDSGEERRFAATAAAAAAARALDDGVRFAEAVLTGTSLTGEPSRVGSVSDTQVALVEEALGRLDPAPSPTRARLLMALASELQWGPARERRIALATEATAMAREVGDPGTLSMVLARGWVLVDSTKPFLPEMWDMLEEEAALVQATGDPLARFGIERTRAWVAGAMGDRPTFDQCVGATSRLADDLRMPMLRHHALCLEAAHAGYRGDLAESERLALEAFTFGTAASLPGDIVQSALGSLFYNIRIAQGRVGELVPAIEDLVRDQPGLPVWRLALAAALVESDRVEEARPHYGWLAADSCANVPLDMEYPVTLCGLGRLSLRVQPDPAIVVDVYERLLPFAGTFNWSGGNIQDPNDLGLAVAAAALGRDSAADGHFAAVIELCDRAQHPTVMARAHLDWARVLMERGDSGRARQHAEAALAIAEPLGLDGPSGVTTRAGAIVERLGT